MARKNPVTKRTPKPYETGLDRVAANYQPLTPLSFLERSAATFPDRTAIIHGRQRVSYALFYARARRLASALAGQGIRKGDTVAVMLANTPPMLEAHYAIPMLGAVINALNTRLDAAALAFMLEHGGAKILITDREFSATVKAALGLLKKKPLVIDYDDREFAQTGARLGRIDYEKFLKGGDPAFAWKMPADEWDAIALNYTSGTTGNPKGVVYHHRGAPIVMSVLVNASASERKSFAQKVTFMAAAAPPPQSVLAAMAQAGFEVVHVYGLTEVYGPAVVNEWHEEWDALDPQGRAAKKARQGVRYAPLEELAVLDPKTMKPVPADGLTIGEVMFRGNIVMRGYLKNEKATRAAFKGGWFHSGDLGVIYPDGYIQLKDRSKDIIISGGENISSIEVEDAIAGHPAVLFVAVVARPDPKWGEHPCAFVELRPGAKAGEAELMAFARDRLAKFKLPRTLVFSELPKTSTGKIQKFALRERAKNLG
jgi:fatty-acyl-CoA synthase